MRGKYSEAADGHTPVRDQLFRGILWKGLIWYGVVEAAEALHSQVRTVTGISKVMDYATQHHDTKTAYKPFPNKLAQQVLP